VALAPVTVALLERAANQGEHDALAELGLLMETGTVAGSPDVSVAVSLCGCVWLCNCGCVWLCNCGCVSVCGSVWQCVRHWHRSQWRCSRGLRVPGEPDAMAELGLLMETGTVSSSPGVRVAVWQCATVAVAVAVCGCVNVAVRGSVWLWLWQCVAVAVAVCGCGCVCGSVRGSDSGSVYQLWQCANLRSCSVKSSPKITNLTIFICKTPPKRHFLHVKTPFSYVKSYKTPFSYVKWSKNTHFLYKIVQKRHFPLCKNTHFLCKTPKKNTVFRPSRPHFRLFRPLRTSDRLWGSF
jgi:hypothetical protein